MHQTDLAGKTAVVLINTGSPKSCSVPDIKAYLGEFLSDPHIVTLPRLFWLPLLHSVILPRRSPRSAKRYEKVWTEHGSPLLVHCNNLAAKLAERLGESFSVHVAMRYGSMPIEQVLADVAKRNPKKIVIVPMFPQNAKETSGSVFDEVDRVVQKLAISIPILRLEEYWNDPGYARVIAQSVRSHWELNGQPDEKTLLVFSFHSIPEAAHTAHRFYEHACHQSATDIAATLGLERKQWTTAFQSQCGHFIHWIGPSTKRTAVNAVLSGYDRIDVITPGFSCDCLETIEEIGIDLREDFLGAHGKTFHRIECLNDRDEAIVFYAELIRDLLKNRPSDPI